MYKKHSNPAAIETQEKIRLSLLKELEHKSLAQVKISDLCKNSGVSRNAFYRNFDSLEDALVYHLDTLCVDMVTLLSGLSKEGNYLEAYIAAFFQFWYGHRNTLDLFFRNNISNLLVLRLSEMIEFTMEDSPITPSSPNPIKGYVFFSGGLISILYTWIRNDYNIAPEDLAKWTMDNVRRILQ